MTQPWILWWDFQVRVCIHPLSPVGAERGQEEQRGSLGATGQRLLSRQRMLTCMAPTQSSRAHTATVSAGLMSLDMASGPK